jgi:hypothetical protein
MHIRPRQQSAELRLLESTQNPFLLYVNDDDYVSLSGIEHSGCWIDELDWVGNN